MRHPHSCNGFTLLELILVVALLGLAAGFVLPNWSVWADQSRQRAIVNELHTFFSFARWTAASHRSFVTICPLSDQNRCVDDWRGTISVFLDADNDKAPDSSQVLRVLNLTEHGFTLRSRTAGRGYFQFNPSGMTHGSMGSLVLCPTNLQSGAMTYMAVNIAGRFRSETDEDRDGRIRLPWGTVIQC